MWRSQNGRPKSTGGDGSGWSELDLAALLGDVFLLGHWKNYEELEENLSMPELIQTIKSMKKSELEERKFLAALQGKDMNDDQEQEGKTFDDIRRKALGIDSSADDIVSVQGEFAQEAGFGIGMGLGYSKG